MAHYREKIQMALRGFSSELFTYYNINKGNFSFRKAYYVITIVIQLIGTTSQ